MRVSELPRAEQPAERLRNHGAQHLTNTELLALVLGSSTLTPVHLLQERTLGSLRTLAMMSPAELAQVDGIGQASAARIAAAIEIGRRHTVEVRTEATPLRGPKDVYLHYAHRLEDCPVEEFHVALLDAQHRFERDILITRGILNSSLVHPREVFKEAIAARASAIILVHNHPSGDPTPSPDDRVVTEQLIAAGKVLDIPVQDHVIIGRGRYVSFAEAGLL